MPISLRRLKSSRNSATAAAVPPPHDTTGSSPAGPDPAAENGGPPLPPFLSLREAADWLCVSLSTLKRTIAEGKLETVRVGKHRKVPASYLATYIAKDVLLPDQVADFIQD